MKKLIIILFLFAVPAFAGNKHSIAAVVNGAAISNYDVDSRLDFIIKTSQLPHSARAKLRPQILQNLINEEIQKQEAERLNIELLEEEFQFGLDAVAKNNGIKRTELKTFFKNQGISGEEFLKKIRAEILWGKIVERRIRPKVYVSNQEVEDEIVSVTGKPQFLVSKIIIPIEEGREEYVAELAEKLSSDINKYKVNFDETAKSFSVKPAKNEWVSNKKLGKVKIGKVSKPIKSENAYVIYKVLDKRALISGNGRKATVKVKHLSTALKNESKSEIAKGKKKLQKSSRRRNICKNDVFKNDVFEFTMREKVTRLSKRVQNIVIPMNVGDAGKTFVESGNIYMVMLCGRKMPPPIIIDRRQIKARLQGNKLQNEVILYMRKLTKEAYIEIR